METLGILYEMSNPLMEKDIDEIVRYSNRFIRFLRIKSNYLNEIENDFLSANRELSNLISLILNFMKKETVNLNGVITDIIYEEYSVNFQGLLKQLDQEKDTGFVFLDEKNITNARLSSYKTFLESLYFDIVFLPLKSAMEKYNYNRNEKEFYYNWFAGVAAIIKVKGGLRREGVKNSSVFKGTAQYMPYSMVLNDIKKKEESALQKEHKEMFGSEYEDFPELNKKDEVHYDDSY